MHSAPTSHHTGPVPALRAVLATLAIATLGGCGGSPANPDVRTVAVTKAARTRLSNTMTLQAEFQPYQDVLIHAKVSGYVNPIYVDIGDRVKADQLLATLEVPELRSQLEGARASERRASAEYEIAHINYVRLDRVNRSQPNLVAQQDLDDSQAKESAAAAALATAKAEAERISSLEDYTRVTAPFPGVITKRFVDNGALVEAGTSSGAGAVVELAENDLLRLRFPVPEAETPLIRNGSPVQVYVGALDRAFTGKIVRDSWDIDRSTRTMVVEVDVPNADDSLKAGMYASVTLHLQEADNAVAVPLQALSSGDHPTVLVVDADGKIGQRGVVTGIRTASMAEIRSGVREGDLVVVGDRAGLDVGRQVTPRIVDVGGLEE
jgi:RND family efflux transporter MFP subunit